ncbi:hypothetical protein ACMA5I_15480 [Paracoccaceae bacterium GXU_MW_L88]
MTAMIVFYTRQSAIANRLLTERKKLSFELKIDRAASDFEYANVRVHVRNFEDVDAVLDSVTLQSKGAKLLSYQQWGGKKADLAKGGFDKLKEKGISELEINKTIHPSIDRRRSIDGQSSHQSVPFWIFGEFKDSDLKFSWRWVDADHR